MVTVFWNARGRIHIDYLPSKQTINGDYYAVLLDRFNNILKKKRLHLAKKKVFFQRQCTGLPGTDGQIQFCYELLPHSAYSPFSLLRLFPVSKPEEMFEWFEGKRFITREQLIAETETYFEGLDKSYYSDGLKKLKNCWIKCIELKGDYIEK